VYCGAVRGHPGGRGGGGGQGERFRVRRFQCRMTSLSFASSSAYSTPFLFIIPNICLFDVILWCFWLILSCLPSPSIVEVEDVLHFSICRFVDEPSYGSLDWNQIAPRVSHIVLGSQGAIGIKGGEVGMPGRKRTKPGFMVDDALFPLAAVPPYLSSSYSLIQWCFGLAFLFCVEVAVRLFAPP